MVSWSQLLIPGNMKSLLYSVYTTRRMRLHETWTCFATCIMYSSCISHVGSCAAKHDFVCPRKFSCLQSRSCFSLNVRMDRADCCLFPRKKQHHIVFCFSSPYICCILQGSRMSSPSGRDSNMRPTLSDAATLTAVRKG